MARLCGDEVVGSVSALVRPDGRCYVFPGSCRDDALDPLLAAAAEVAGPDLRFSVDEADEAELSRYLDLGFEVERRENRYLIPTSPQGQPCGSASDAPLALPL